MIFRPYRSALALFLTLLLAPAALAAPETLEPGQLAPGLDVDKWFNGEFAGITEDRVSLIAFFKTTDGRSKNLAVTLSELENQYGWTGLHVAGITDEESNPVERFVRAMGRDLQFPIGTDKRGSTTRAWLTKAKVSMPAVFVVDRAKKLQYIGLPGDEEFHTIVRAVINGRFDAKLYKKVRPLLKEIKSARRINNWRMAFKTIDDVVAEEPHVFAFMNLDRLEIMIVDQDDPKAGYEFARKLIADYGGDGPFLAALATKIATDPMIPKEDRDLAVAMEAATAAAAQLSPQDPGRYSVPALVHFSSGRVDEAIQLQKKAYFVAHPKDKQNAKRILEQYQDASRRRSRVGSKAKG